MIEGSPGLSCATLRVPRYSSSGGAVALREIFRAAHFLEAAGGALEFEAPVAFRAEIFGLRIRCGEQLHLMLVERVDQGDEARRFIAHVRPHYRDADN